MDYFNIHNHTEYSNIYLSADSINKVDKLIDRAKELGLRGIAITDHGVISAHVKALQHYKKRLEEDETWKNFTLGLGEEIYLCENGRSKETAQRGQRYPHCIVVAKDAVGHKQLRQLSSMAWARSYTLFMKRIPSWYSDFETVIGNDKGHLIVTSACIGGIMRNAYDNNSFDEAQKIIDWALEWFGEDFYLELAPAGYEEQISYNKWLIDLSLKTGIKLIMATDSHYLSKEDFKVHEAYLKSKEEERETADFYQYTYLMSQQECRELLSYLPQTLFDEIVKNTKEIADKIEFYDLFTPQIIPHLDDDRCNAIGWAETLAESRINPKYEYINKYKNSEVEDDRYFIYLVLMKLKELHLEKEKLQEYLTRIETECYEYWETSVRLKQPIASYILMVREVERIMWEEANSLVGISRGSAGSTLVNYLCGLTQMNPMEQGIYLPEWRFIHHSKIEIPDVDVDSEASKKDIIRKKLKEKAMRTGGDAVAICTFGTEGSRSAILTACRSIGLTPDEGQFISSLVKQERGFSWSISDCYYGNPDKDREPIKEFQEAIDSHPGLLEIVLGIEGLVGRSGIHACFDEHTKVITKTGAQEIKDISIGDEVLTIDGSYQRVMKTTISDTKELYTIYSKGIIEPIKVTGNHPIWALRDNQELWVNVENLREDDLIGTPINTKNIPLAWDLDIPITPELLWFFGRFVGDGWLEERSRKGKYLDCDKDILLCCNKNNNEKQVIEEKLKRTGLQYRISEYRTSYKFIIHNIPLLKWMRIFGKGAYHKTIPTVILDLPNEQLQEFLNGYLSADGHENKHGTYSYKTISPSLALGLNMIYHKLNKNYVTNNIVQTTGLEIIENRVVRAHNRYTGLLSSVKKNWKSVIYDNKIWFKIDRIEREDREQRVYNLEVENNHTYLANGIIVHNCGVNILNHAIYENNALMTAPNGTEITQFDLGDSDYMGGLKMDCLTVEALDKIHICMDLLIKNGLMEWQGSLKSTYNKYLHPDVLERNEPKMWKLIADNKIIDAFQMDSTVAKQTLAMVKPTNIPQLAQLNTLMRLMPEKGQKTPAEEYVEFKNDPLKLKRDIYVLEATDDEKETLYNFMKGYGGVLDSQESAMLAVMLPFTNYDVPHANKIRKIIAKKKLKEVDAAREEYYKIGLENGTSKDILWYIWDVNIKRQMAYSFSLPHTTAYSLICLQEMNLNYFYPAIYWATAVLTVNAGANETNEEIVDIWEKEDNDNEYEDLPDRTGKIKKTTDYAKIASAIGRIKANGYEVELPLINKAQFGFEPDTNNNAILYGLKGISEIGDDIAKDIINKRPYTSVEDFISKCPIQKKQMINLIKAGAFTEFEDRRITMNNFLASVCPKKARITLQNMGTLVDYQLIPKELISYVHLYNFNKYIKKGETPDGFKLDSRAMEFIAKNFPDIDCSSGYLVAKDWKKTYEKQMEGLKNWLKENEELLVKEIQKRDIQEIWDKYCIGNNSAWEMDVLGFYYSPHELSGANIETTKLKDLKDNDYKHQSLLAGTVLGKNVYKHTVTILCPDGVVDLKMTNELFANYNKTISKIINGEKKVLEKSWFTKGTLLSVAGYKMGETFRAKALSRIISIDDLGDIKATKYRYGEG